MLSNLGSSLYIRSSVCTDVVLNLVGQIWTRGRIIILKSKYKMVSFSLLDVSYRDWYSFHFKG